VLRLQAASATRRPLALLSFVIGTPSPTRAAMARIGGLQGSASPDAKEAVIAATRDLFGLRPKRLLVEAVYGLVQRAEMMGTNIDGIVAVSNQTRVHYSPRRPPIMADYDGFWEEWGANRDERGHFHLPSLPARRRPEDVPARKRKAWRHRQTLIDQVVGQIVNFPPAEGISEVTANRITSGEESN
jgi:uncharacterized protein VirK/YbjX